MGVPPPAEHLGAERGAPEPGTPLGVKAVDRDGDQLAPHRRILPPPVLAQQR
jgi:hypothetical protein